MSKDIKFYKSSLIYRVIVLSINIFLVGYFALMLILFRNPHNTFGFLIAPLFFCICGTCIFYAFSTLKVAFSCYGVDEDGITVRLLVTEKKYSWEDFKDFEILSGADSIMNLIDGGFVLHQKQGEPLLIQNSLKDYAGFLQDAALVYTPMRDCDITRERKLIDYENENERRQKVVNRNIKIAGLIGLLLSLILFALWYSDLIVLGE